MATEILQRIQKDLEFVKKEIIEIREHMVDADSILTEEDYVALQDYRKQKSEGKLISHDDIKKELGL